MILSSATNASPVRLDGQAQPPAADSRRLLSLRTDTVILSPPHRPVASSPPPSPFAPLTLPLATRKGRRKALFVLLGLSVTICTSLLLQLQSGSTDNRVPLAWSGGDKVRSRSSPLALRLGERPGKSFKDSLRPDRRYLTAFSLSGFNNQLISAFNLLHLAHLLQLPPYPLPHIVILPPVSPHYSHLRATEDRVEPLLLSKVFDLRRFEKAVGFDVVEWRDVKDLSQAGGDRDKVACWSSWWTQFGEPIQGDLMEDLLGLERTLTPLPPSLLSPSDRAPHHFLLPSMANFLNPPDGPARRDFLDGYSGEADRLMERWGRGNDSWRDAWGDGVNGWRTPDGREEGELVCFDVLYFASERGEEVRDLYRGKQPAESYGPWSTVGRHLHWDAELETQAKALARSVIGLEREATLPPFVTMHIRRGDFVQQCPPESRPCLRVAQFEHHLLLLQEKLLLSGYADAKTWPVIVTTDETDPTYLAEIIGNGWLLVEHANPPTAGDLGHWGPTLIDNVLLSLGKAFIGTEGSTMSILALRRVQDWSAGHGDLVPMGEQFHPWQGQ